MPTVRLTQGESTPLSITLRLASPYAQLAPALEGGADLVIERSAQIERLSSGPGLFQFQWQVLPLAEPEGLGASRPLIVGFYSEKGRTGLRLPLRYIVAPPARPAVTTLLEGRRLVADPEQPIDCPDVPPQALAHLNRQLLARDRTQAAALDSRRQERESLWQERLEEANRWQERYLRFTKEIARLGVDQATLHHLQELLDAGSFARVRARIDDLRQQLHDQLARVESLEAQSHILESFDYAAALPHLRRAKELQPASLDYALDYADALARLFHYQAAVAIYREVMAWEALEPVERARVAHQLGNAQQGLEDYLGAVASYDRAIELMETLRQSLAERWPPAMANDLAAAYMNRGTAEQGLEDYHGAVASYDRAIELMETLRQSLAERWPPGMANDLAIFLRNRALLHWRRDRLDAALADFEQSRDLTLPIAAQTGSFIGLNNYLDAAFAALALRTQASPDTAPVAARAAETAVAELIERHPTDLWPQGLRAKLQRLLALCADVLGEDSGP